MINCTAAVQIAVSFLWAIYTAAIAPSTVRRANSQMNISCTAAVHIAFAFHFIMFIVPTLPRPSLMHTTILYETVGTLCNKNSVPRSPKSMLSEIVHWEWIRGMCISTMLGGGGIVPTVTQSHTGLHDRPMESSTHELAKLSSLFSGYRKCLKLQNWYQNVLLCL